VQLWNEKAFLDWAAGKGLDRKKVEDVFGSFAINGKMNRARQQAQQYNIQSVPTVVVDGKFITGSERVGTHANLPGAIDELIVKARAEHKKS
jgi:thiol:disulfide interchange protein DsbA